MPYRRRSMRDSKRTFDKPEIKVGTGGRPPLSDGSGEVNLELSVKSLSGLPKSPVSMLVDPYTNALPGTMPYPLLNVYNRNIGGSYGGFKNLDGGTTVQYNNARTSKFLDVFDSALIGIRLNYRYLPILPIDTNRGGQLIDEMRKAISEATSTLSATTFTAQNIYYYAVETDLPMGSATTSEISLADGTKVQVYKNIEDVVYAASIFYQLILQQCALAFNNFNCGRAKQGLMINMSWNREVPYLNSYFGLLNKKAFLATWDAISYGLEGEYFDEDFMQQTNLLSLIPSRRSNSMNDPLMEVLATFAMPTTFKLHLCTSTAKTTSAGVIFDYEEMKYTDATSGIIKFADAVYDLVQKMSVNDTLLWARLFSNSATAVTDVERFNTLKSDLSTLNYCLTYFKTCFNDLRTVFDIMSRSGVNKWKKGVKLKVTPITEMNIANNLTINNIYALLGSGPETVYYDDVTKRWRSYSLWNIYYGIPEHDAYAGGCFFSFSTKNLFIGEAKDTNIGYLPIAFSVLTNKQSGGFCRVLNRRGVAGWYKATVSTAANNPVYARLVPLDSQNTYELRVATFDASAAPFNTNIVRSQLYKLGQQLFGTSCIKTGTNSVDYALDPDILCVYDYQIEDFTNEVITYARSNGPFVANATDTSFLGFYGLKKER